jgi:hypothetical protein
MTHGLLISLVVISLIVISFNTSHADTTNYVYDELNRLIRVEYGDGTIIEYIYDNTGNRSHLYVGKYTLTVNVVGNGTVTKNPDQPIYGTGTNVTLTAVNGSQTFTEWSGDLTGSTNPSVIVMNGNKTVTATFSSGAWLQGWTYRKAVTLSRASGAVTNYQMRLLVGETSGASGEDVDCNGHVQADFDDLRFTTSGGATLLDYWIESITGTTPNQLATVWIKFDSIGTDATTFYMYYGNAGASAVSSITATFIAGDNGVNGNFTEAVSGSAVLSHASGYYHVEDPNATDVFASGVAISDFNKRLRMGEKSQTTGNAGGDADFVGYWDATSVANVLGDSGTIGPNRRFLIHRYSSYQVYPNQVVVYYLDAAGTTYYWDNTTQSWTTNVVRISTSGSIEVKVWDNGTNFYADVLQGGSTIINGPASVAMSSVKSFSNGKVLLWTEPYTNTQKVLTGDVKNYTIGKYYSPEPAWGSWGAEQSN